MSASRTERILVRALVVSCVLLILANFVIHPHGHYAWEEWPGAYAVYGFAAYVAIVTFAKGLRKLVRRDEDYYEPDDDPEDGDDQQGADDA